MSSAQTLQNALIQEDVEGEDAGEGDPAGEGFDEVPPRPN